MPLLRRAVERHQQYNGNLYPSRAELLLGFALEPLRQDPRYAPPLEQLIREHEAWLGPAREQVLAAERTSEWEALRVL
jgi:hypothetical protein